MKITKDTAVTLHIKVADAAGKTINDGKQPTVYLHGGYENIFPKIEAALDGQETGFQVNMALAAEDAFGARDEALARTIPKAEFPPGVKVGGQLQGTDDEGRERIYHVVKIKGPVVHLDANHPMAGIALQVSVKVADVRAASKEEIAHGHVHGEHGHHH